MTNAFRVKNSKSVEAIRELLDTGDIPVNLRIIDQIIPVFQYPHMIGSWAYDYVTVTGNGTFTFGNIKVPKHEQWYLDRIIIENATAGNGGITEVRLRVPPEKIIAVQFPPADMIVDLYNSSEMDYWSSNLAPGIPAPAGCYIDFVAASYSADFVVSMILGFRREGGSIS